MLVDVRLLRWQGCRIPWRDIANAKFFRGNLRPIGARGTDRPVSVRLLTPDGLAHDLLPELFDPVFTGANHEAFFLRGIERLRIGNKVHAAVQEWECTPTGS